MPRAPRRWSVAFTTDVNDCEEIRQSLGVGAGCTGVLGVTTRGGCVDLRGGVTTSFCTASSLSMVMSCTGVSTVFWVTNMGSSFSKSILSVSELVIQ